MLGLRLGVIRQAGVDGAHQGLEWIDAVDIAGERHDGDNPAAEPLSDSFPLSGLAIVFPVMPRGGIRLFEFGVG